MLVIIQKLKILKNWWFWNKLHYVNVYSVRFNNCNDVITQQLIIEDKLVNCTLSYEIRSVPNFAL